MKDYYKILRVRPNASLQEIKNSFRNLAREFHPDINKSKSAKEKFLEINEAYEFLCNTENRRTLDIFLTNQKNRTLSEKLEPIENFLKAFISIIKIIFFALLGGGISFLLSKFLFDFSKINQIIFSGIGFAVFGIFTLDSEFFTREIFAYKTFIIFSYFRSFVFGSYFFILFFSLLDFIFWRFFPDSIISTSFLARFYPAIFVMAIGTILPKDENYTCIFCEHNIKKIAKMYIKCISLSLQVGMFFLLFYFFEIISISQIEIILVGSFLGSLALQIHPNKF